MTEYISIILKVIATFAITAIFNTLASLFRKRHLYATIHTILDGTDPKDPGHTFSITIGNVGKNKEKGVKIHFPKNKRCKVISRDYPGITASNNEIKIDRLLSGQKINASIFVGGIKPEKKENTPQIISEDANGKVYFGYGREPINAGPTILVVCFFAAIFSVMSYSARNNGNPFEVYYHARYWQFYKSGFTPSAASDNTLIYKLSPWSTEYPVAYKSHHIKDNNLYLIFEIKNNTEENLKLNARFDYMPTTYYTEIGEISDSEDLTREERVKKYNEADKKYDAPAIGSNVKNIKLSPGDTTSISIHRPIKSKLKETELEAYITIETGTALGDRYTFIPNTTSLEEINRTLDSQEKLKTIR
jgi:hypothetical protein